MTTIALLPGDGIGSEILDGPVAWLRGLEANGAPVRLTGPWPYGTTGWRDTGSTLPDETVEACRTADVILSGAVGSHPGISSADCPNPEAALIRLRQLFDLRVSIRVILVPGAADVIIVRNITGGAYGSPESRMESDGSGPASDPITLEPDRIREVFQIAAELARRNPERRAISADKASVFATSRLWRRIANEAVATTGVAFSNVNIDRAAYELVASSELPGMIVTEGIFGDILSDVVCARAGSPALCGSATINPAHPIGNGVSALFEPAHGTSPHRTGKRRSNPTGAWLAVAALLDWCSDLRSLGLSTRVRRALDVARSSGPATYDLARPDEPIADMDGFNERVLAALAAEEET